MKIPIYPKQDEFERMYSYCKDKYVKLAILLGFESGMRISEIVGLTAYYSKCCSIRAKKAKIRQKSGAVRIRYYCPSCNKLLEYNQLRRTTKEDWDVPPLTPENVDLQAHKITIRQAKGGKDRSVPLPQRFTEASLKLLPLNKYISYKVLENKVKKLARETINKQMSFHGLRHGFACDLIDKGVPLNYIQNIMGHARLDITGRYLQVNPSQAIETIRRLRGLD